MIHWIFRKANQHRKRAYFETSLFKASKTYAFVGFGFHSLSNLYPVLTHFGIRFKYICTRESVVAENIRHKFPATEFIHSLAIILEDPDVEGVFVSAEPTSHFQILMSLLKAGKHVFIEKPPCENSSQLETLIAAVRNTTVVVGLQRRFWPGNLYLLEQKANIRSYIYRYCFGPYPQGDSINELFIHAIDYCIFLFGELNILSVSNQQYQNGLTIQMHVQHKDGKVGMIELSTHGSWSEPVDSMTIQSTDEFIEVKYPMLVQGKIKPRRILNFPAERLFKRPIVSKIYYTAGNMIIPAMDLNSWVVQGFYGELKYFIEAVENKNRSESENNLIGLRAIYRILEELRNAINR